MVLLLRNKINVVEPVRTTYAEVFFCVLPFVASILLRNCLHVPFPGLKDNQKKRLVLEYLFLLLPFASICFEDFFTDQTYPLVVVVYVASVLVFFCVLALFWPRQQTFNENLLESTAAAAASRSAEIRQFRAIVYVATVVCIFARDLPDFRLRFAKSLAFGTALMDVGIGCFVFCMGMAGPTARLHRSKWTELYFTRIMIDVLRVAAMLLLIGLSKLVINMSLELKQPVFEYGTNWNVFLTLAVIKLLGPTFELLTLNLLPPSLLGLLISVGFELVQEKWLKEYLLLRTKRGGFIDSNREGLIQLPGLLALYLMAVEIGRPLFRWRSHPMGRLKSMATLFVIFCITCIIGNAGKHFDFIEKECRMSTNFSYVLFMIAFPTFLLGLLFLVGMISEWFLKSKGSTYHIQESLLFRIDKNGFTYFLCGNVFTGIGHVISFFYIPPYWNLFILIFYASLTTYLSVVKLPKIQDLISADLCGRFRPTSNDLSRGETSTETKFIV